MLISLDENGHASGQLYEDDGEGYGYQKGDYLLTTYDAMRKGTEVVVTVARTEGRRARPARRVVVQVLSDTGASEAEGVGGQTVSVKLPP